jgi:hypothetical protein
MNNWSEQLPDRCPPEEAYNPNGQVFYRLCQSNPASSQDFLSNRFLCPTCNFPNVSECIALSLSVFIDMEKCLNIRRLPRHKNSKVMYFQIKDGDGLVLKTSGPGHYSWWRTHNFDIALASVVE